LKIIHDGTETLIRMGIDRECALYMKDLFGPSGICNILGAIKMAKYLKLGPGDNVVTIATDGFDRYDSVIEDLDRRYLEVEDFVLERWLRDIFLSVSDDKIYDFRKSSAKEQLFNQKEKDWIGFGYTKEYLDSMKSMEFWDNEYNRVFEYNKKVADNR
jgi:hypothetical protein